MTDAPEIRPDIAPFDDEDTDGAARFEQATRAARDLAELVTDQTAPAAPADKASPSRLGKPPAAAPSTSANPLQPMRVVFLVVVMAAVWFGFMLWDTWGG